MRKTHPLVIVVAALVGAALGWLLEVGLVAGGRSALIPPITFAAVLLVLAVAVVAVAVPVRRVAKGASDAHGRPARVDPFYATRVLALAKSAVLVGAVLTGGTLAILGYVLSRPVVSSGTALPAVAALVAALAALVAGLVAEEMCRIPPGKSGESGGGPRGPDDAEAPSNGGHP